MFFYKRNSGKIANWWWEIDKISLSIILIMLSLGAIMVATTSPAVADRIGVEPLYFIRRQIIFLLLALITLMIFSFLSLSNIKKISIISFFILIIGLILVLFKGTEIKGATRWFSIGGISIQPSEFMKPIFALFNAYILSRKIYFKNFPSFIISLICYLTVISLLILQPDLGMVVVTSAIWGGQLFIAGLKISYVIFAAISSIAGLFLAYKFLPHVHRRIESFINPTESANYQVERSLDAFMSGGLYGRGPGEGMVKQFLPDSHTDFIFAVIAEELGAVFCMIIIILFATIVMRGLIRIKDQENYFIIFAACGIIIQFGMQAFINMGVTLNIMPTKGMTLPFISYGGSSMLAISMGIGVLLGLTRHRYGIKKGIRWSDKFSKN